jgi:hypothetical protein
MRAKGEPVPSAARRACRGTPTVSCGLNLPPLTRALARVKLIESNSNPCQIGNTKARNFAFPFVFERNVAEPLGVARCEGDCDCADAAQRSQNSSRGVCRCYPLSPALHIQPLCFHNRLCCNIRDCGFLYNSARLFAA